LFWERIHETKQETWEERAVLKEQLQHALPSLMELFHQLVRLKPLKTWNDLDGYFCLAWESSR